MKTFRYARHEEIDRYEAEGWKRTGSLNGTRHAEYAELMEAPDRQLVIFRYSNGRAELVISREGKCEAMPLSKEDVKLLAFQTAQAVYEWRD